MPISSQKTEPSPYRPPARLPPPQPEQPRSLSDAAPEHKGLLAPDSAQDSSFLRWFMGVSIALTFVCAAINYLVDPFAIFGTRLIPPVTWMDRDEKTALYQSRSSVPTVLVFGSSRMMKVEPGCVHEDAAAGYNFAVNSARAEDFATIYGWVAAQRPGATRRILLGLDPEALHGGAPVDDRLIRSPALQPHLPTAVTRPASPWLRPGEAWLSAQILESSARSLARFVSGKAELRNASFDSTGFLMYQDMDFGSAAQLAPLDKRVAASVEEYRRRYHGFAQLSPWRVEVLEGFLRRARRDGVVIDVVIPPLHPSVLAAVGPITARTAEVRALARQWEGAGLLRYHETASLHDIAGDANAYYDGAHMTTSNTRRLLTKAGLGTHCAL